jgi:hypothetical protein
LLLFYSFVTIGSRCHGDEPVKTFASLRYSTIPPGAIQKKESIRAKLILCSSRKLWSDFQKSTILPFFLAKIILFTLSKRMCSFKILHFEQ